jgi:glyoxylase-like metal-dependent hydrolase (beta-lactamase superfamily II)
MTQNPRDQFQTCIGKSPEEAKFYWTGGPVEVAERTYFASMFSGVTAFDTDAGLVLIDSGMARLAPGLAALFRQRTQQPVHTAIYTHGHVDHAYGLPAFLLPEQQPPRVVGHANMPARFARYAQTQRHNAALNARQFGGSVSEADDDAYNTFASPPIVPNQLYDEALDLEVGGIQFQLRHCRGETDDHTWIYCPERSVLCPGDLFIWGVPNAGNPQKAQRYPWDWADGLRAMAALEPKTLCPGHGGPVVNDCALVVTMLSETADFLQTLVERTLAVLEAGSPPHVDVVHRVEIPQSESPWLQPVYDEAEFIVRNIVRYYGGWFSGRPCELKPASRRALAHEFITLSGGVDPVLTRIGQLSEEGDYRLACHLADFALEASPNSQEVRERVAEVYLERAGQETSLMAINLYRSAAAYAQAGRDYV